MTAAPDGRLSLILPMAGGAGEDGFRGLATACGESLARRAVRSFAPFRGRIGQVCCIVLKEHEDRFGVSRRLRDELAAELDGIPLAIAVLDAPTAGPAESVAACVAQAGLDGPAIVCDIDHRLDLAPLFAAIADTPDDCLVSLWPLAGEDLKRWSVACANGSGDILAVADNRLPGASGFFHGVIGCYYFPDIAAVAAACRAHRLSRFSTYFNALAAGGTRARGVRLAAAEFFGDAERIRALEGGRGTIFCDIDGTLIRHQDRPDYGALPELLPGSREKLKDWIAQGYCVVLCTARRAEDEPRLAAMLRALDLPYHRLLTGLPSGTRIVVNDRKPHAIFTAQAASLEIARDAGIAGLELGPARRPAVLRRFAGGSLAETLLLEEGGRRFVRKRVAKDGNLAIGYHRLRDQFRTLERFALLDGGLVPALYGEENNSHEYFYDMEFLAGHAPLADCAAAMQTEALGRLLDRFDGHFYCRRSRNRGAAQDWLLRHFEAKIAPKIAGLSAHAPLRPLLAGTGIAIDGVWRPSLQGLLDRVRQDETLLAQFVPQFLSLVHGDLTFQNILLGADGDLKVIDMEAQDGLEAVELDLGKLFQSVHGGYEVWSGLATPLCAQGPDGLRLLHTPPAPDAALAELLLRRWSAILGCADETVAIRGEFYLGLHLARMAPFRLRQSLDQAAYALALALIHLDRAVTLAARAGARQAA